MGESHGKDMDQDLIIRWSPRIPESLDAPNGSENSGVPRAAHPMAVRQPVIAQGSGSPSERREATEVARRICGLLQHMVAGRAFARPDGAKRIGPRGETGCWGMRRGAAHAQAPLAKWQVGPGDGQELSRLGRTDHSNSIIRLCDLPGTGLLLFLHIHDAPGSQYDNASTE